MNKQQFLKKYEAFCEGHDDDYIYDEIHEFFGDLRRGDMIDVIEIIKNSYTDQQEQLKKLK